MPELIMQADVTIEVEVWCSCGNGLCGQSVAVKGQGVSVEPCEKCLDEARENGYSDGYDSGHTDGEELGDQEGFARGYREGYHEGYRIGRLDGYHAGLEEGKAA